MCQGEYLNPETSNPQSTNQPEGRPAQRRLRASVTMVNRSTPFDRAGGKAQFVQQYSHRNQERNRLHLHLAVLTEAWAGNGQPLQLARLTSS